MKKENMERMQSKIKVGEEFTIVDLRIGIISTNNEGFVGYRIPGDISLMSAEVLSTQSEEDFQRIILKEAKRRGFQTFEMCTKSTVEPSEYANTVFSNTRGSYLYVRHAGLDPEALTSILDRCRTGIIVPTSAPIIKDLVEFSR